MGTSAIFGRRLFQQAADRLRKHAVGLIFKTGSQEAFWGEDKKFLIKDFLLGFQSFLKLYKIPIFHHENCTYFFSSKNATLSKGCLFGQRIKCGNMK